MSDNIDRVERALDDLHSEFEKASLNLDAKYNGPAKTADQRTSLISVYSAAVACVLEAGYR